MRFIFGKIRIFQIDGIEVCFHWSYLFCPVGLFLWLGWVGDRMEGVYFMLGMLFISAISLLFHEYCHCLAARLCSVQQKFSIILIPVGAAAVINNILRVSPLKEMAIALAGPVGSAALGGIAWMVSMITKNHLLDMGIIGFYLSRFLYFLSMINFWIAAFNIILFIFPADGGRICRAIVHGILLRSGRLDSRSAHVLATKIIVRSGWVACPIILIILIYTGIIIPVLFILLPLLCIVGEVELFALKESYHHLDFEIVFEEALHGDTDPHPGLRSG